MLHLHRPKGVILYAGVAFPGQLFLGHRLSVTFQPCCGRKPSELIGTTQPCIPCHGSKPGKLIGTTKWTVVESYFVLLLGSWDVGVGIVPISPLGGDLQQTLIRLSLYFFSSLAITVALPPHLMTLAFLLYSTVGSLRHLLLMLL